MVWWFYGVFGVIAALVIGAAGFVVGRVRPGRGATADSVAALATVAAALAAGATLFYADRNERRLEWERTHQHANKVYLGEAPQYYYDQFPRAAGDPITIVVINGSGIEVKDVWVEDKEGGGIRIEGIQRCTLYSVPRTTADGQPVDPKAVHFTDPYAQDGSFNWKRTIEGRLTRDGTDIPPDVDFAGSNAMDVEGCSG